MNKLLLNVIRSSIVLLLVITISACATVLNEAEDILVEAIKKSQNQNASSTETEVKTLSEYIEDENYESAKNLLDELYDAYPSNLDDEARFIYAAEIATSELQYSHDDKLQHFMALYPNETSVDFFSALYLFNKGARIRGADTTANTPRANLDAMRVEMEKSVVGFEGVLQQHPESYLAHSYIGKNYSYIASRHQSDIAFRKSLVQEPASFTAWNSFLWYNAPRWGGSYAGMMRLLNEMGYQVSDNPRLARLRGVILADKASIATHQNKYEDAETLLMQAMDYGVVSSYTRVANELHAKVQAEGDTESACRISQKVHNLEPDNQRYKDLAAIC